MVRAFIAIELDDPLRRDIARVQEQLKAALQGLRVSWVRPASMHVTLKFLGDIDPDAVPVLHDSIAASAREYRPIDVPLVRLGAFPRLEEPRNLWLGPNDGWAQTDEARLLQSLVAAIDACCRPLAIEPEKRPFSPHLTLGRIKAGERHVARALAESGAAHQPLALAPLVLSHIALMKSQLDSKGAIHTRLWHAALANGSLDR